MPEKKHQARENISEQAKAASELADQASRSYAESLRSGQQWQEQAVRWWSQMWAPASAMPDWQRPMNTFASLTSHLLPLTQRRMEELMELMEKNGRTTATLMQKAADAVQTPDPFQSQAKWLEFWTTSLGAVRSNAEAFSELSSRAFDAWLDFIRNNTEIAEVRVPKAA